MTDESLVAEEAKDEEGSAGACWQHMGSPWPLAGGGPAHVVVEGRGYQAVTALHVT